MTEFKMLPDLSSRFHGQVVILTTSIPKDPGGMSRALLARAGYISSSLRQPVTVACMSAGYLLKDHVNNAAEYDLIPEGVDLRSPWDDIEKADESVLNQLGDGELGKPVIPLALTTGDDRGPQDLDFDGVHVFTIQRGDRLPPKLVDRREKGKRCIQIFSESGQVLATWTSARAFYYSWLDLVFGGEAGTLIVESKSAVAWMYEYSNSRVAMGHVVHGTHLDAEAKSVYGQLTGFRNNSFRFINGFDFVVFLTNSQRRDAESRFAPAGKWHVIPNYCKASISDDPSGPRSLVRGISVGRLEDAKRPLDAVEAVANTGEPERLKFEFFGAGESAPDIRHRISELDLEGVCSLKGFSSDIRREMRSAGYLLMTSTGEGQSLVILEAMAEGCIPISYDVRYGPSEIITHGVNGFLVPSGDVAAMAETIDMLRAMPEIEVAKMRKAAVQRAADFSPSAVAEMWIDTLADACHKKRPKLLDKVDAADIRNVAVEGGTLTLTISKDSALAKNSVLLAAVMRGGESFFFKPMKLKKRLFRDPILTISLDHDWFVGKRKSVFDLSIQFADAPLTAAHRIKSPTDDFTAEFGKKSFYTTVHGNLSLRL